MHDLRQRHCPIITTTLLCLKWPRLASLLWSHCQSECKITSKNKISHKVKLLACDLMWKIFTPFLAPVNSREKDEHPSYSRANYVPAGGRNPTPPRKAIVLAGQCNELSSRFDICSPRHCPLPPDAKNSIELARIRRRSSGQESAQRFEHPTTYRILRHGPSGLCR
jgi:hypothetical protein